MIGGEEDIAWLDVAMQQMVGVKVFQSFSDLGEQRDRFFRGKGSPLGEGVVQVLAGDVFEKDVGIIVLFADRECAAPGWDAGAAGSS